jgi:lysophospholipase L1-like esterase
MIAPGAQLLSDPVELNVAALSDLAVSVYLPGTAQVGSDRGGTSQTSYVSLPGDFSGAPSLPVANTIWDWPLLAEVDVDSENGAVVALGDALTAGRVSALDANNRWPDLLARRLLDARVPALRLAVVNLAAGGNQLLPPAPGRPRPAAAALDRFEHDVPATAGVRYMVAQLGIEDIGYAAKTNPSTVKELIAAYSQLIARAHARGIAIFGATLTPFEGTGSGFYSPAKELVRWQLNTWIRSTDDLDGVVDFDLALRDPMHLARLLPAYDSGDHFHPNDLGYQAMANAVPLDLFKRAAPPAGDTK